MRYVKMPKFSQKSLRKLESCDERLQWLFEKVIEGWDCTVTCGHRGEKEQNDAYDSGHSKLKYPLSNHNRFPSFAVDVVPYPINWEDIARFRDFGYFVLGVAHGINIHVRWGADWNRNYSVGDEKFLDWPHYELVASVR